MFAFARRRKTPTARPRTAPPHLEALEAREVPTVTPHSGIVLPQVEAQALYYGPSWQNAPDLRAQMEGFLQYIVNSPYMDMLQRAGYGVGRGTFTPGVDDPAPDSQSATIGQVNDFDIRSGLVRDIQEAGGLQAPDFNRLYVVFVAPGVTLQGGNTSEGNLLGYHNSFVGPDGNLIRYAVVMTPGYGTSNAFVSALQGYSVADNMTAVASHELAEAVTDPDPKIAPGWTDDTATPGDNEIGDFNNVSATDANGLPNFHRLGLVAPGAGFPYYSGGYMVQDVVDQAGGSIFPSDLTSQAGATPELPTGTINDPSVPQVSQEVVDGNDVWWKLGVVNDSTGLTDLSHVYTIIDWGDGSQTASPSDYQYVTDPNDPTYAILYSHHTYANYGDYNVTVTFWDLTNGKDTFNPVAKTTMVDTVHVDPSLADVGRIPQQWVEYGVDPAAFLTTPPYYYPGADYNVPLTTVPAPSDGPADPTAVFALDAAQPESPAQVVDNLAVPSAVGDISPATVSPVATLSSDAVFTNLAPSLTGVHSSYRFML
jgi:hypothetical protein